MTNSFERVFSVVGGFALLIAASHLLEIDWQLALMALRDATYGRWVPEFSIAIKDRI